MSENNQDGDVLENEEKVSKEELENTIKNLNDDLKSLEKVNSLLRDRIYNLEQDNQDLKEKLENTQLEESSHPNIENNVHSLQKKISKIEIENSRLKEESNKLKGGEKAEESIGNVQKLIKKRNAAMEESSETGETWKMSQKTRIEIPKGKVKEMIQKRNTAMEELDVSKEPQMDAVDTKNEVNPPAISTDDSNTNLVEEVKNLDIENISDSVSPKEKQIIQSAKGRRFCPECGNSNQRLIHEVTDRTKLISVYPRMYGKKFRCGECGAEWR